VAGLNLTFVAGLAWFIITTSETAPYVLLFGLPSQAAPLFILPWLAALLTLGLLVLTVLAWKNRDGSVAWRVSHSLLILAALGFVGLLSYWGLLTG
jgi:hypothetical protein